MSLAIRRMKRVDLERVLDWAADEGWNPGVCDAGPFLAADPDGFFIGEIDGRPVGAVSAVAYDEHFGFGGLYIVRPEFRGQGHGRELVKVVFQYLEGRNIGIDGVVVMEANYRTLGFRTAYRHVRHEVIAKPAAAAGPVELGQISFDQLVDYDARLFSTRRPQFLRSWIAQPGTTALGHMRDDRLIGYGVLRRCRKGHKIGPLFADDPQVAEEIFQGLSAAAPGELVYLDIPDANEAALALAERHGMKPVFETARMYTGVPPKIELNQVYGATTLELG